MLAGLSSDEFKSLLLSVGTHRDRRSLSPVEAASLFKKALAAGASVVDCAEAVRLAGPTWIARFLKLLELPEDVRHLVGWGRKSGSIAFTSASDIARLEDSADQRHAIEASIAHDLSSLEVRQLVQLRNRSHKSVQQCVSEVLKLRPHIEVKHIFVGSIISEKLRKLLRSFSQSRRDELLNHVCRERLASMTLGARLGETRFTLVGGKDFGDFLAKNKERLEQQINDALEGTCNA
jgi:hypothetical protein